MPPLVMLGFWIYYAGILRSPLALMTLGPIMLVPSIWLLRVIWRSPRRGR